MEKYTFLEKIGRGTHGTVYLLQAKKELVVCKTITEKHAKYALREINILLKLNNKRIIKLVEHIKTEQTFYLILEHANHGTLETILNYHKKNEITLLQDSKYHRTIWQCISQIVDALCYLHSKKIIHRDIKPSNILTNHFFVGKEECLEFKLCDFSLSTTVNANTGNLVGTPFYMAPEIIRKINYDERVDVWSLGICLYEMITLKRPFNGKSRKELQNNIVKSNLPSVEIIDESNLLYEILMKCLNKDHESRVSVYDLRRIDRIKYCLALSEIKLRDRQIFLLENKIEKLEMGINYMPTPENTSKKSS
ncbi:hypothetical protein GVAV_002208 [Gurleya vavrai]